MAWAFVAVTTGPASQTRLPRFEVVLALEIGGQDGAGGIVFFATGIPGWTASTPEQETTDLKNQADWLKEQLDAIQKRIDELTSK